MSNDPKRSCDFCYFPTPIWTAEIVRDDNILVINYRLCDSCRLLLRNVIALVLHKMTQGQVVEALVDKMKQLGIDYQDLMNAYQTPPAQTALRPRLTQLEVTSGEVVAEYDNEPVEYSGLDRSFDDFHGMGRP